MTTLEIEGDRNIIKGRLKQKLAKLTDNKLKCVEGKSDELLGRIQKHTSEIREAIKMPPDNVVSATCHSPEKPSNKN
jgi:uncharacterized protein YjbJ (UPF0337 family)